MNAYNTSVGKHDGKSPFGKPSSKWESNIRMALREVV
jgi:hypothetical protein